MTNQKTPRSRTIRRRIIVEGELQLLTPTALGNGDAEGLTDMPLLLDMVGDEPLPLLTGSSIAGALRNYLRSYENGYTSPENAQASGMLAAELFGAVKGDSGDADANNSGGEQSRLIVDDALAYKTTQAEVRDGVRINNRTRTAEERFKYDLELLPAGVVFPLRFELLVSEESNEHMLREALALALHGLETSEIHIGGRKTRGFGRCVVEEWRVTTYDLHNVANLLAWLTADHEDWEYSLPTPSQRSGSASSALEVELPKQDTRHRFSIVATFALESPILIRSEAGFDSDSDGKKLTVQPDVIHIRNSKNEPILPGTSLAGVLRARATRIVNTTRSSLDLNKLFGRDMHLYKGQPSASRLIVNESTIQGGKTIVQNRVAIDRFTGGALDTALFDEAPQLSGDVELSMTIHEPEEAEKGLLLLILRDLWTGDLPIGGTSSIGRGRLRGLHATIVDENKAWEIRGQDGRLNVDDTAKQLFTNYVNAFKATQESQP